VWKPFGYGIIEPLIYGDINYTGLIKTEQQASFESSSRIFLQREKLRFAISPGIPRTSPSFINNKKSPRYSRIEIEKGLIYPYYNSPFKRKSGFWTNY
jgi:hypothetical protein